MLEILQKRLRLIAEYEIPEWALRLEEVGGPGVGGTELAYTPHFVHAAENDKEFVAMALESSIPRTWEEAAWCYVYGKFRACIVMSAALLEITLRYELYRRDITKDTWALGKIIKRCSQEGIISDPIRSLAELINQRRNDIMHSNIQRQRPKSLLYHTGDEHEIEPITNLSRILVTADGKPAAIPPNAEHSYSVVFEFKRAARASLFDTRDILKYFYSSPLTEDGEKNESKN